MKSANYKYLCLKCHKHYPSDDYLLACPNCAASSLLQADYDEKTWQLDESQPGMFRYRNWLPAFRNFSSAPLPAYWQAEKLAKKLGLSDLDIVFSGYCPENGGTLQTASFKEFEAYSVCAHIDRGPSFPLNDKVLVIASAGNTARAFAQVGLAEGFSVLLVIPEASLSQLKTTVEWPKLETRSKAKNGVKIIITQRPADQNPSEYADAIQLANLICQSPKFYAEGGVKNIARRDGLAIPLLRAWEMRNKRGAKQPYAYYFQAIGSGTGAIATYEMYQRLRPSFAPEHQQQNLKLMLAQNSPFTPVSDHWQEGKAEFSPYQEEESKQRNSEIMAPVLANRFPPYSIQGGLYQVLRESQGQTFAASNQQIREMQALCAELEGVEIAPAAAVALSALEQAVRNGQIDKSQPVLLHLTGGGESRLEQDLKQQGKALQQAEADLSVDPRILGDAAKEQELIKTIENMYS